MKRQSTLVREESYEHVLMCLICRSLFDDCDHQPKFLPCHHTFCKDCLREYVRQMGDDIECPSCRKVTTIPAAGVTALQTNFYVKYIQGLVHGAYVGDGGKAKCAVHSAESVQYYCKDCDVCVCAKCCDDAESKCTGHNKVPITTITEECHHRLDKSFTRANALIEHKRMEVEALLKALSQEKDDSLKKIDSTIEQHVHTLHRRATLLKNKVIDIYNEHVTQLETDLEEVSTAMTCIVSLKEYHEELIGRALCQEIDRGVADIEDVFENINQKICPAENHIVFEDKHGVEKFKMAAKDLGRVRNSRPTVPRSEPEGGRDLPLGSASTPMTPQASDSEFSPVHGNRLSLVGAEAAACGPIVETDESVFSELKKKDTQNDKPNLSLDPKQNGSETMNSTTKSKEDNNANKTTISDSENTSDFHVNTDVRSLDSNSNQPSFIAARPKCFDMTKRKVKTNTSSSKLPKAKVPSSSATNDLSDEMSVRKQISRYTKDRYSKQALVPTLKLINPVEDHLKLPDLEALKKTDKMYHHLVYTSYDEEELLKELKSGKVALADPNISFVAKMSESDSWMTASSTDELSMSTGDENSIQQSAL